MGKTQVARQSGLSRESLHRAQNAEGNPSFATVLKVARALEMRLHAEVLGRSACCSAECVATPNKVLERPGGPAAWWLHYD